MKVTFKSRSIYFSNKLVRSARLRKGSKVFLFSVKGTNTFGFHKADKEMEDAGMLVCPVRITPTGKLYVTPIAPPVSLITATMRLSYKHRATVEVVKAKVRIMDIFIFKKKRHDRYYFTNT